MMAPRPAMPAYPQKQLKPATLELISVRLECHVGHQIEVTPPTLLSGL